jgi:hypothetical protein
MASDASVAHKLRLQQQQAAEAKKKSAAAARTQPPPPKFNFTSKPRRGCTFNQNCFHLFCKILINNTFIVKIRYGRYD